jgi:Tfp pilus assembly protein PilO
MTSTRRLATSRPALIGIICAMVIVGLWYELFWSPQSRAMSAARQHEADAAQALFVAQQRLGHLKHLSVISPAMRALDARLTAAMPDEDAVDAFIIGVNNEAVASGVTLSALSFATPSGSTIGVQMSVTGGYFAVERFFDAMRDGPRVIVLDSLSLTPGGTAGPDGTMLAVTIGGHLLEAKTGTRVAFSTPVRSTPAPGAAVQGNGVLATPITKAKSTAAAASASANASANAAASGGTP